jgi:hypothetical protein
VKLMLAALFLFLLLGLLSPRLDTRHHAVLGLVSSLMVILYYVFAERLM